MANKRISELAPYPTPTSNDLLLISDVSAHESKKLTLGNLSTFILSSGGNFTGSLMGTASYVLTASYLTPTNVYTISGLTSSGSINIKGPPALLKLYSHTNPTIWFNATGSSPGVGALSFTNFSCFRLSDLTNDVPANLFCGNITASALQGEGTQITNIQSASYARTSSYALTSLQSVLQASFADQARTASYLYFVPGGNTGTASYAWTASSASSSSYSSTSSYALNSANAQLSNGATYQITSSWANNAKTASYVQTASFLAFNGVPNGTASYAIYAASAPNIRQNFGTFNAITQSIYSSQLDMVSIIPTFGGQQVTSFEVYGTAHIPFSSSRLTNGQIEMFVLDRATGYSQSLDFSSAFVNIGWASTTISGTMCYPFTLYGEASLYGLYQVYVTASNNDVYFDTDRTMKYKITSTSDQLLVQSAEPMLFSSYPIHANMLYSSSLYPGVAFQGSASQVIYYGSNVVTSLTIPPSSVNNLYYTWTLSGLVTMSVDNNPGLSDLGGIPNSCVSMSAANCGLSTLPYMSSGSLGYLNVPGNTIVDDLALPISMSYVNVAGNYYVNLPPQLPAGLTVLIADGIGMTNTPFGMPNSLITASFNGCSNLHYWMPGALPTNLGYVDTSASPLSNFPTSMPSNLSYVNVSNCRLSHTFISNIAGGLVSNGLSNGLLAFINNPSSESAFNIIPNITTLRSRGWTVIS
jgi:hypothetical protein